MIGRTFMAGMTLLAGACAGGGDYPSLAVRDVERLAEAPLAEPAPPAVPAIVSASQIEAIVTEARALDRRFAEARSLAERFASAAAGSAEDSPARSRALVALADLASIHDRTALVLSDLDTLEAEAAGALAPLAAIRAAQSEVAELTAAQDGAIAAIDATFAPPE